MSNMTLLKNQTLFREENYINGQWCTADNQTPLAVLNPFDQKVLGHVPFAGEAETLRAVEAAQSAFPAWKKLPAKQRCEFLLAWADLIEANIEDLAILMTLEHGKSLAETKGELQYGLNLMRWFAEQGRRSYGDIIPANKPSQRILVTKEAIGVAGIITPWNFPMATPVRKIAAALAAGCTVVMKPAELTPFSAIALAVLAEQTGLPKGVFNLVTGDAAAIGKVLTSHPAIKIFSFTGSTPVGKLLNKQCADTLKKVSLELGGNSPLIVFDDANVDLAVQGAMDTKFRNMGQTCVCTNRIFVHESIYDEYVRKFVAKVNALTLGNGLEAGVSQGPLVDNRAINKITGLVEDAVSKGATVLTGGKVQQPGTNFFEPTVIVNADEAMDLYHQEIFGPVAVLYKFSDESDVYRQANDTPYGLASYVFTNDLRRALRASESLESGVVSVNEGIFTTEVTPFGGFKESGIGREGGKEGLEEYLELKYVCIGDMS